MALRKLVSGVYIIPGSTTIGVIADTSGIQTEVYLVDSGGCRKDGEKILSELTGAGFSLRAIINTHSHADHCGGNAYLTEKTGCGIWTSALEKGSLENGRIQSSIAWGGYPLPELESSYYVSEHADVTRVVSEKDKIMLNNGTLIEFVPLPGHYFEQLGILCTTTENKHILFTGDAVFGRTKMAKYWIPFLYDVNAFKDSLDRLCTIKADWYVPSHGEPLTEIEETTELNKIAVLSTETCIISLLQKKACTAEELLKRVADYNSIPLRLPQFVLIGCTIRSYISYLYREKKITYTITDNRMIWSAVEKTTTSN
jgi:glyoxylase-like metal-dependent hydrolase (beta-lactamase superfamily II)